MTVVRQEEKITVITTNETRRPGFRLSFRLVNRLFLFLIIILGLSYVATANALTVKGFELRDLKKQSRLLGEDNKRMETEIVSLNAYGNMEEKIRTLGMVKVDKIDFIKIEDGLVAKK